MEDAVGIMGDRRVQKDLEGKQQALLTEGMVVKEGLRGEAGCGWALEIMWRFNGRESGCGTGAMASLRWEVRGTSSGDWTIVLGQKFCARGKFTEAKFESYYERLSLIC